MHSWMMYIHMGNDSNIPSNVTFQTFRQLMEATFHYHLHRNITRMSHGLYNPFLPLTQELSLVQHCNRVLSRPHRKCPLGYTGQQLVSHFVITSLPHPATHWVPCNFTPLFEMLQPTAGIFKINAHLQGYFIGPFLHFSNHCKSVLSSMLKPFKQLVFHIAMFCGTNPHVSKYRTLGKPAVQENPDFLNMMIEWRVGFH